MGGGGALCPAPWSNFLLVQSLPALAWAMGRGNAVRCVGVFDQRATGSPAWPSRS